MKERSQTNGKNKYELTYYSMISATFSNRTTHQSGLARAAFLQRQCTTALVKVTF